MGSYDPEAFGILCPKCKSGRTCVVDTVPTGGTVDRRRDCKNCKHQFHTTETTDGIVDKPTLKRTIRRLKAAETALRGVRNDLANRMPKTEPVGPKQPAPYKAGRVQWIKP